MGRLSPPHFIYISELVMIRTFPCFIHSEHATSGLGGELFSVMPDTTIAVGRARKFLPGIGFRVGQGRHTLYRFFRRVFDFS